jgi:hypothetical protein
MRTKHANRHGRKTGLPVAAALLLLALPAVAAELTVASYVDLTIKRLELAYTTWSEEDRSPVETEEAALCQLYGATLEAYYAFAGEHRQEIEDYLSENTAKRDRIDSLAADIAAIIEQKEVK